MTQQLIDTELDTEAPIAELDISHLVIEDDTPVDNFQSEEQQRLLVEPLYSNKVLPAPFLAAANVGLFYHVISLTSTKSPVFTQVLPAKIGFLHNCVKIRPLHQENHPRLEM